MPYATALCSFTCYEPWTNKDIIPAAGRGRKLKMLVDEMAIVVAGRGRRRT